MEVAEAGALDPAQGPLQATGEVGFGGRRALALGDQFFVFSLTALGLLQYGHEGFLNFGISGIGGMGSKAQCLVLSPWLGDLLLQGLPAPLTALNPKTLSPPPATHKLSC